MSSGVYAAGVKATAISNITAAVNARISVLADGSKQLDVGSLQAWLATEAQKIIDLAEYAFSAISSQGQLANTSTSDDCNNLAAVVIKDHWTSNPAWPQLVTYGSAGFITALSAAIADLQSKSNAVGAAYDAIVAALPQEIVDYYGQQGIDASLPPTVVQIFEDRFYIHTYVTDWDEESAPGLLSDLVTLDQNDTVTLSRADTAPAGRHIVGWRVYRSITSLQSAAYELIAPKTATGAVLDANGDFKYFDISATSVLDDQKRSELQESCPTMTWLEPPSNLRGLIGMPNGIMAGYFGNTVCFCEPYEPYAWPVEYQLTCEYPITGLGVFGQVLVVFHQGGVDYIGGADSASMSQQKNVSLQACVSERSIVSGEGAVFFASPDGVCSASGAGVIVMTTPYFTREDWSVLVPSTIIGAYHEQTYVFLVGTGSSQQMYALHGPSGKLVTIDAKAATMYVDKFNDVLYFANGTQIVAMFSGSSHRSGTYRTKIIQSEGYDSFAWMQIASDFAQPITVKWYGDGQLVYTVTVTSTDPVRMPDGRYKEHEFEVTSSGRWSQLTVASTTEELASS